MARSLLRTKHHVLPGMFLVYGGAHPLFAGSILAERGQTRGDFVDRLERCRSALARRVFLPKDFRFSVAH